MAMTRFTSLAIVGNESAIARFWFLFSKGTTLRLGLSDRQVSRKI